jgi:[ribosomal protein S5]-alanine N-acetyltransferase
VSGTGHGDGRATAVELPSMPVGERVLLRHITAADEAEFTALAAASAGLLHPWMAMPVTAAEFTTMLGRYQERTRTGAPVNLGLLVCERGSGAIAGLINMSNIVYGRFQSSALGYCAFAPAAGRGYLSEGLRLVIRYAFDDLGLHRLEANIQPGNDKSIALVQRAGFRYEGLSPFYLFIDEAWRDHERWALTREIAGDAA